MIERLTTGNERLDEILGGGLAAHAITLIGGSPGTGKTILAEQCLFANASTKRPGLYLATVSEPFDKLLRYGQSLDFFDATRVGQDVFYDELGYALHHEGLTGVMERIEALVKEHLPGTIVIDSFKALRDFAPNDADFRRFLHDLAGRFGALAISSFWVGEYVDYSSMDAPEFGVADTVLLLATKRAGERSVRYLSVVKFRGSGFSAGEHAYRLSSAGIDVFPRLADALDTSTHVNSQTRVSTGIPALDHALGDGYWPGSTTLIAGPSGAGKTVMGLHYLYAGAERNEPGILVTLQENNTQMRRIISGFGWSHDAAVTVMDRSPVALMIDELVYEILEAVSRTAARRIVIDSIGDLMLAAPDPTRFREFVYSLVQRCSRDGISLLFTFETVELFRVTCLSEVGMSHIADNVVLLQHIHDGASMKRSLTVLKTRGSTHEAAIREFNITSHGITLGDPIDLQALLP